jgi:VWFA-related protein
VRQLVLALVVSVASVAAQQAPAEQAQGQRPPTIRTGTNLVRVDVTVLDQRGDPVKDLTADDFHIEEDGIAQPVQSFQLVEASGDPASADEPSLPIRSAEHARAEAAREDVRIFLIFWDEYHLHPFVSSIAAREALSDFVLNAFGPRDLVALMDPLMPSESIRFTRDRRELADAIRKLNGRRGVYMPARSVMEEEMLRRPQGVDRVRYEVTMTALKAAAVFLGTLREGRKSILFVSEGTWRMGTGTPLQREVIQAANEHNAAIYTMDPRGLGPRPSDMLMDLANSTGGQAIVNTNAPARFLKQIVKHASAYYLLGYSANTPPSDGRFHKVRVKVKRRDLDVRARSGYWAPSAVEVARATESAGLSQSRPLAADARAAIAAGSARRSIDLWVGSARGDNGLTAVTLAWAPHQNGRDPDLQASGLDVTALGPDGHEYFQSKLDDEGRVSFHAPPGLLQLKLAVLDGEGAVLERDVRRISVPNFSANNLSVSSPVLLRARTPLELRGLMADPDAPPFIGREFRRGDRLLIRFEVYGQGSESATIAARLMTRTGAMLVALPIVPVTDRPGRFQIDLPLGATARGDFMIAIEASLSGEQVQSIVPLRVGG